MKQLIPVVLGFILLLGGGCGRRTKEITSLQRKEAATLASEAEFAVSVRDFPRAEKLLTRVVDLCPDNGDFWIWLGSLRMRSGDRQGAKSAYESGRAAFEDAAKLNPKDSKLVANQIRVLALLGRIPEARKLIEKMQKQYPADRSVQAFVESREFDEMVAAPGFKEIAL
jgi:Flp pilus assembly protein TadD